MQCNPEVVLKLLDVVDLYFEALRDLAAENFEGDEVAEYLNEMEIEAAKIFHPVDLSDKH